MTKEVEYGRIRTVEELGRIVRTHRKHRNLTLERISGLSSLSLRFLSEFERGKETAEIGKVLQALHILGLEVIIQRRPGWKKTSSLAVETTSPAVKITDKTDSADH